MNCSARMKVKSDCALDVGRMARLGNKLPSPRHVAIGGQKMLCNETAHLRYRAG